MIESVKIVNFRNFEEKKIEFSKDKNIIVWENWKWKTNILEALSILSNNTISWVSFDNLVKENRDFFYIETINSQKEKLSVYYEKNKNKKIYSLNWDKKSKKKIFENIVKSVVFSPIIMNLMFLWPSIRRDFLDSILKSTFSEYEKILKDYKDTIKSRNKILKNIHENKSKIEELNFWDERFINLSVIIYSYRFKIVNYIKENINNSLKYFENKVKKIEFKYITKVDEKNIKDSIKEYLKKNLQRDLLLRKTYIWAHIDDFEIVLDWKKITDFASRWEIKSLIIWLKIIETNFIEKITWKKPIIIIDDLISELDEKHKNLLLESIKNYQTFISSIYEDKNFYCIKI